MSDIHAAIGHALGCHEIAGARINAIKVLGVRPDHDASNILGVWSHPNCGVSQ